MPLLEMKKYDKPFKGERIDVCRAGDNEFYARFWSSNNKVIAVTPGTHKRIQGVHKAILSLKGMFDTNNDGIMPPVFDLTQIITPLQEI